MSFPPTVGTKYQTLEERIWVVASVNETGLPRGVRVTTDGRAEVAQQEILEEEWDDFEAEARVVT